MGTSARDTVKRLVDHFDQNRKVFLSGDCKDEKLSKAKTPHETEVLQRLIAAADRQIDTLVCVLYGLTEEEIRIVEAEPTREASAGGKTK